MDPKSTQPLDPKLQEAYDKVMGVPVPPTAPVASFPQTATDASSPQSDPPSAPQPIDTIQANTDTVTPSAMDQTVQVGGGMSAPFTYETPDPSQSFSAKKKKMKISPIVLTFGAVIFLIVYSLVWIKVFNLRVPYINP